MTSSVPTEPAKRPSWAHGILYGVSSLVLGVELNLVGPTAAALARQVASTESALGPVVGLGGIGLLVGGMPAGWLLDKLPGHGVIATAQAIQAVAFCLLPHCATLPLLAAIYCCAAFTFNAITTGSNALILWYYPSSHGAWLNLASALFGVGCFLAPVLADLAGHAGPVQPDTGADSGPHLGPFALHGGDAALAYYIVAAGAAACCLWTTMLPSPARPPVPEHHHDHDHDHGNGHACAGAHEDPERQAQTPRRSSSSRRRRAKRATAGGGGVSGGSSAPLPCRSTSSSSVLDMGGVAGSASARNLAVASAAAASTGTATSGSTWGSGSSAAILSDGSTAADGAAAAKATAVITVADLAAAATKASSAGGANVTADGVFVAGTAVTHLGAASDSEGEAAGRAAAAAAAAAAAGNHGGFGSVLSPCSPATTEAGAGAADQDSRQGSGRHHHHRHQGESLLRTAAAQLAGKGQGKANGGNGGKQLALCPGHQPHHQPHHQPVPPRKPAVSPTTALFRRYLHELSMGWPVLGPVVVLLFANISTQASFGAWVTTYCRRAVGLDEAGAQAVTAAYWAAFTGTRMAGVAVAPFLHASSVLLITSPFAVAGGALAVMGLPQILFPAAASAAPAAFAAGLPMWALYVVVSLVGVGCATGFANTVSLTSDHLQLDGFTNGILSSVAGLASTLCPAAVPWLAEHTAMGYGALMVVVLCMSVLQLVSVCGALLGARWVDEWLRIEREEDERAEAEERAAAEAEAARLLAGAAGSDVDDGCDGGCGSDDLDASRRLVTVVVVTSAPGSDLEEAGSSAATAAAAARRPRRNNGGAVGDNDLTTPLL